jgi:hypothetical protein
MTRPELWGWSTAPLTIDLWGWEDASDKGRLARAPRMVQAESLSWAVLDAPRSCAVVSVSGSSKSVRGYYHTVTVASASGVPSICCAQSAYGVSCGRATPKVHNSASVEKVVKGKSLILSPVSAWPAAVRETDSRRVPRISI